MLKLLSTLPQDKEAASRQTTTQTALQLLYSKLMMCVGKAPVVRYSSAGLQSGGCGFESQPGLLRTKVYTQPSIPPGSVNEYQLRLGRQRQVWLFPIADERVGVQVIIHHIRFWYLRYCGCPGLRGRQHLATPHTRSP